MPSPMIMTRSGIAVAAWLAVLGRVAAQQPASTPEVHPPLTTWKCTKSGGCVAQNTSVVLDWNYREITQVGGTASCKVPGSNVDTFTMSPSLCPNEAACAKNCEVHGANYTAMGVTTSGGTLTMYHYTRGPDGKMINATPRILLLGPDDNYVMLKLVGQELSYDVDLSKIPCGENGALYLSEMDATGNKNEYNQGGAAYGTGYCDAQCPVRAYRNGRLNTGRQPACCAEMDIQEANSRANAFTPHPCRGNSCDAAGCGYNPYQSGQRNFYGPGQQLDTNRPFTVVTQFIANGANLSQIKRLYVQNGRTLPSANGHVITGCGSENPNGGMSGMGQSLNKGMVLIFSIWNDPVQNMGWLDSGSAGPCGNGEGTPANILSRYPDTHVIFSNIRWGDIGSTVKT